MTSRIIHDKDINELKYMGTGPSGPWYDADGNEFDIDVIRIRYLRDRRWVSENEIVWQEPDGRYFSVVYELPLTEIQEDSDEPIDPSDIIEVEPYEYTAIDYREKI